MGVAGAIILIQSSEAHDTNTIAMLEDIVREVLSGKKI